MTGASGTKPEGKPMSMRPVAQTGRRIEQHIARMPATADDIVTTTCYMCACRCGIRVHLKDRQLVGSAVRDTELCRAAITAGFLIPLALLLAAAASAVPMILVALSCLAGIMIERWLSFAEARHRVAHYFRQG